MQSCLFLGRIFLDLKVTGPAVYSLCAFSLKADAPKQSPGRGLEVADDSLLFWIARPVKPVAGLHLCFWPFAKSVADVLARHTAFEFRAASEHAGHQPQERMLAGGHG